MNLYLIIIVYILLLAISCSEQITTTTTTPPQFEKDEEKLHIIDGTGKKWDITYAVNELGFKPELFDGGGGPFAIEPIINPQMLNPGDPAYPKNYDEQIVIGYKSGSDIRAYTLHIMALVEIANDYVDSSHVAVAY